MSTVYQGWDEDRDAQLIKLHGQGLSYSRIGDIMGVTRCAISGRVNRLKARKKIKCLELRKPTIRKDREARVRPTVQRIEAIRRRAVAPKIPVEPIPPPRVDDVVRRTMKTLEHDECKFPIGDPKRPDFGFCGLPQQPGGPYCSGHHARCNTAPTFTGLKYKTPFERSRNGKSVMSVS